MLRPSLPPGPWCSRVSEPGRISRTRLVNYHRTCLFQALDQLRPHEVYVATGCAPQFALWGGLMTTRALHLKAAGAVLDGYSRDTFGDRGGGVLIVPKQAEEEAIRLALEKATTENEVRTAIEGGMRTVEAFRTFGVM